MRRFTGWSAGIGAGAALILALTIAAGCSSGHPSASSAGSPTTNTPAPAPHFAHNADGMRAAALAWSNAFLTGTPTAILNMEGPECIPESTTTFSERVAESYLKTERDAMRHHFGVALDAIGNHGVAVRNLTANRGEAVVLYDLPQSAIGNDNWVEYTWHDNSWKVSDCHSPIGGQSTSPSSIATTSTAPTHG